MVPYAVREGAVTAAERELVTELAAILEQLPEISIKRDQWGYPQEVSCHMLVRAIARVYRDHNLEVVDGYYYPNYQHSWMRTAMGNVIDVYPVAGGTGPILIAGNGGSPVRFLYRKGRFRPPFFGQPWFRRGVRDVTAAIRALRPAP